VVQVLVYSFLVHWFLSGDVLTLAPSLART
jgi:hypothetical protein